MVKMIHKTNIFAIWIIQQGIDVSTNIIDRHLVVMIRSWRLQSFPNHLLQTNEEYIGTKFIEYTAQHETFQYIL